MNSSLSIISTWVIQEQLLVCSWFVYHSFFSSSLLGLVAPALPKFWLRPWNGSSSWLLMLSWLLLLSQDQTGLFTHAAFAHFILNPQLRAEHHRHASSPSRCLSAGGWALEQSSADGFLENNFLPNWQLICAAWFHLFCKLQQKALCIVIRLFIQGALMKPDLCTGASWVEGPKRWKVPIWWGRHQRDTVWQSREIHRGAAGSERSKNRTRQ